MVDNFLDAAQHVNWAPSNAPSEPHGFIVETIMFLEASLLGMQQSRVGALREELLSSVLEHVAHFLAHLLSSDAVRRVNAAGAMALETDVKYAEEFEQRSGTARRHFVEVRQLTALLLDASPADFVDLSVQRRKYRLISTDYYRLLTILEKWEMKSGLFMSRDAKNRKAELEQVTMYLKQKTQR